MRSAPVGPDAKYCPVLGWLLDETGFPKKLFGNVHEKNVVSFVWLDVGGVDFGVLETIPNKTENPVSSFLGRGKEDEIIITSKNQKNQTPVRFKKNFDGWCYSGWFSSSIHFQLIRCRQATRLQYVLETMPNKTGNPVSCCGKWKRGWDRQKTKRGRLRFETLILWSQPPKKRNGVCAGTASKEEDGLPK